MTEAEALETARIHSLSSKGVDISLWQIRPYRAPHHSASAAALVGGGGLPKPGEVSLAHNGVLFLDEIPEFSRFALEQLREPMESGGVSIARARARHWYPARFQLIAAMNPCPCGWYGESGDRCRCSPDRVEKYRGKVSGPLLDRMDLHVEVAPIPPESFADLAGLGSERSLVVRERVIQARDRQSQRGVVNSQLAPGSIFDRKIMTQEARRFLAGAAQQKRLTTRSHHRVFRVARTIADLADEQQIKADHIAEALNMRCLDRQSSAA